MRLRNSKSRAFVLFEVMLAVGVFVFGVIALGRCVQNCLRAESAKQSDAKARRVLENRMAEIQAGAVQLSESSTEDLKGPFTGMTLKTKRSTLKEKNEKNQDLLGLYTVSLEVLWKASDGDRSRTMEFYYFPRQR